MSVALVEDDDSSYPPPKLRDGSPQIPTGVRQPAKGDTVFVDTSAMFVDDSRLPLLLLSFGGYLDVCWSPYVDGEVARVATREQAVATLTRAPQNLPRQLTADLGEQPHRPVNPVHHCGLEAGRRDPLDHYVGAGRKLAGNDRGARARAVLEDLQQIAATVFRQRAQGEVVEDQHVDTGEAG